MDLPPCSSSNPSPTCENLRDIATVFQALKKDKNRYCQPLELDFSDYDTALKTLKEIENREEIPANFMQHLTDAMKKEKQKKLLQLWWNPLSELFWDENRREFRESWNLETINDVISRMEIWKDVYNIAEFTENPVPETSKEETIDEIVLDESLKKVATIIIRWKHEYNDLDDETKHEMMFYIIQTGLEKNLIDLIADDIEQSYANTEIKLRFLNPEYPDLKRSFAVQKGILSKLGNILLPSPLFLLTRLGEFGGLKQILNRTKDLAHTILTSRNIIKFESGIFERIKEDIDAEILLCENDWRVTLTKECKIDIHIYVLKKIGELLNSYQGFQFCLLRRLIADRTFITSLLDERLDENEIQCLLKTKLHSLIQ